MPTSVSAVVVNFNGGNDLLNCIGSLQSQTHPVIEVIVVDNVSTDDSLAKAMAMYPGIKPVANATNTGFAEGANQGARVATGDVLLFLNPDVTLAPDCIDAICQQLQLRPGVAGVALSLDADVQDLYGCTIDRLGYPMSLRMSGEPLYVPGAALATSRPLFETLGGFDGRFFMFVEDVDFCWRTLLAGFDVSMAAGARASHRGGASTPGGYIRSGRIETTIFRFVLRERNSLATLMKCAPVVWLLWIIPAYLLKSTILVLGAVVARRLELARGLIGALVWNVRQTPATYKLRHGTVRTRAGQRSASQKIYRGWLAIERLREHGLPRFIDRQTTQTHESTR